MYNKRSKQKELIILKRKPKLYNIASFDVETYNNNRNFLSCGLFIKNKFHYFTNKDECRLFIKNNIPHKTILYATNLLFDFEALYQGSKDRREAKINERGGKYLFATHHGVRFGDTKSYTPSSVKQLGSLLNLPKINHPTFLGTKPKNKNQERALRKYNRRDCLVTKTFVENFQKVLNDLGGEMKGTIASCSLDLYRRKYMPQNIKREFYDVKDFIKESYYGGRTEAFRRGTYTCIDGEYYYIYDVNSLYPSVMLNEYPLPESCHINNNPRIDFIHKYHGVSDVTIECPEMYYPLLPYRANKLIFPIGTFKASYNHIELRKALELGYKIKQIHKQIYYTKTFYPFKKYIEELYALRLKYKEENNEIYATVVKLLMNSLYGKFAQNDVKIFEYVDLESDSLLGAVLNEDGYGYRNTLVECDQAFILPILSSTVTSYARLVLYNYLTTLKGIYCDTDSIFTREMINDSKTLGDVKCEKIIKKFRIIRPKLYNYEDKYSKYYAKAKGIQLSEKPEEDIDDILLGKKLRQLRFRKTREAFRTGKLINETYTMWKKQNVEDDKRDWLGKQYNDKEFQDSKPLIMRKISLVK